MGVQPILPVTVPVKKIKDAARQCYGDGDGVVRCEQTLTAVLKFSRRIWFINVWNQQERSFCGF